MKLFTKKKVIPKMTIVLVFLILFNFIAPTYSKAAWLDDRGKDLLNAIAWCSLKIGDVALNFMQNVFVGTNAVLTKEEQMKLDGYESSVFEKMANGEYTNPVWFIIPVVGPFIQTANTINVIKDAIEISNKSKEYEDIYQIQISPWKIFSGVIYALNIDFISKPAQSSTEFEEKWFEDYNDALKKMEEHIASITDEESDELIGWSYAYLLTKGTNAEISQKVSYWYNEMNNSYSDEAFYSVIAMQKAFESKPGVRNYIIQALQQSGMCNVVSSVSSVSGGSDSILRWAAQEQNSPAVVLHDIIATWYRIMRNIALVALLCILVYIGIKIMLSSTAADGAKYKKMLVDWVVAICILFALHYIMAFAVNICQLITNAIVGNDVLPQTTDEIINEIRKNADGDAISNFGYIMVYLVLVFYTVYFLFYYVKRVVYAAFLTLIAPLVAVTYPVDKMADGKSQAFDMWVKEYIMNIIMQPLHLLIYTAMVTSAMALAKQNPIYAIVVIGAMIPVEKFIKEMFGIGPKKGPNGGPLVGAAVLTGMQRLAGRTPPKFPKPEEKNVKEAKEDKNTKKPRMDSDKIAELSRSITDGMGNDSSKSSTPRMKNSNTSTENQPGIDNGDFDKQDSKIRQTDNNDESLKSDNFNNEFVGQTVDTMPDYDLSSKDMPLEENMSNVYMGNFDDDPDFAEDLGIIDFNTQIDDDDRKDFEFYTEPIEVSDKSKEALSHFEANNRKDKGTPIKAMAKNEDGKTDEDINDIKINTNKPKVSKFGNKKRNIKAEAARATAMHYWRQLRNPKANWNVAKKILKTAGGVVGAGVGATLGLAAGVASGDPSKTWQYSAAMGLAGGKLGSNLTEGVANTAQFAVEKPVSAAKNIYSTYQSSLNERLKYDAEVKRDQKTRANAKYVKSKEWLDKAKKRYGLSALDGDRIRYLQERTVQYKNKGIDDDDTIFNCINLENGMDAQGNSIKDKLTGEQAMLVGLMHEQGVSRRDVKDQMKLQFADNIYADGESGYTEAESVSRAKEPTKQFMKWYDMAGGLSVEDAGRADVQEELKDAKDEARRMQNIEDQAAAIEKAKRKEQAAARKAKREARQRERKEERESRTSSSNKFGNSSPQGMEDYVDNSNVNPIDDGNI